MKIIKILNYCFPIVIGAICSSLGTWMNINEKNTFQVALIILLSVLFSCLLYYDGKKNMQSISTLEYKTYQINFMMLKNIVIQLFAIIIGAICSSLGGWDINQPGFMFKIILIAFTFIIYIGFVIMSVIKDEKINKQNQAMINKMQQVNCIYENVLESISIISHDLIRKFENFKNSTVSTSDVEQMAFLICHELWKILDEYDAGDFSVSYSKRIENNFIKTIAIADGNHNPYIYNIYGKKRKIDQDMYMDSRIMKERPTQPIVFYDNEEIGRNFQFTSIDAVKKYKKYIAIPVYGKHKVQAVLQIVYYTESTLFNVEDTLRTFLINIFPQYINISVMIEKLYELVYDPKANT